VCQPAVYDIALSTEFLVVLPLVPSLDHIPKF